MNDPQPLQTCLIETLQCSYPQFKVGIDRILYQHGEVEPLHGISQSLHGKRIGRGTRTHPEDVHTVLQSQFNVLGCRHLC